MEEGGPRAAPPRRAGVAVGRVLGVPLYVSPSTLLFAALVTLSYGDVLRGTLHYPRAVSYAVGLCFGVFLLGSVLLHELGHALTARWFGIGVRGITLQLLGGFTELDRDAPRPSVDLLVALAGPAVSLACGGLAVAGTALLPTGGLPHQLMLQLAVSNLVVAAFNALPGLPLDGGRALRAAVWALSRDRHLGTEVAGWTGRVVAVTTGVAAVALTPLSKHPAHPLTALRLALMLLVTLTLWYGAGQAIRVARISRRFPLVDLGRLTRPLFRVPTGTPLAEAQRRAAENGPDGAVLGVADSAGRLVGVVRPDQAEAVPAERRPWVSVDSVARDVAAVQAISAGLAGEQVVQAVQAHPGAEYLVTAGEDVLGVLRVADLAQLLEPRSAR